jgi:GxxExxY protein
MMDENQISKIVFECALKIHKKLGPGLMESAYEECLYYELCKSNITVEKQKPLHLIYENIMMDIGYRVDLMISSKVIIEIKAVENISNIHLAQLLTYLKLSNCKLGLLINFNVSLLKNGFKRAVNNL